MREDELKQVVGGAIRSDDCLGKEPSACFGTCTEIVGGTLKQGKCKWATYPYPLGSDCYCTFE